MVVADDGVVIDKSRVVGGRVDLTDKFGRAAADKKDAAIAAHAAHNRDDVCLDYGGDVLTWGQVDDYVDLQLLEAPLNIPPQATLEQINRIIASSKVRLAEIAINTYLREALVAPLALKAGLSVSDDELTNALFRATQKASRKKHAAEVVPKLRASDGYFSKYQRNYLLSRKYVNSILAPGIEVPQEELAGCISNREVVIAATIATNAAKRVEIEGYLEKIRSGELDFGEVAYEHSDCGSSMENGDWGEFDRDCSLLKPLKDFIFAPSKVEMSDVIETPYSYHIVKILDRFYDDPDEDEDSEEGDLPDAAPSGMGRSGFMMLAAIFACAAVLSAGLFLFLPKHSRWRIYALLPVWGGAVAAAAVVVCLSDCGAPRAPTRVHVAHIMLEKEEVPPPLDADGAREELRRQKLAQSVSALQKRTLEEAQANGTLKCAVRMTLLGKSKMQRKAQNERGRKHEK